MSARLPNNGADTIAYNECGCYAREAHNFGDEPFIVHCQRHKASSEIVVWARDLCPRLHQLQKQGVLLGADTCDALRMLERALDRLSKEVLDGTVL